MFDLIYMGIDFSNLTKLPRFEKVPIIFFKMQIYTCESEFCEFDKVAPIWESPYWFLRYFVTLDIHVIHLDLTYMAIYFANLTNLPRFEKVPIVFFNLWWFFRIYFMKIRQLCQIEHTPWISISYILFFVFCTIWQSCPIFIKYIQKKKGKVRDSIGGFRNRGNFVKFAKRMYPAPVSRHESKPTRDAPCARTATRRVITILML